MPKQTDHVLIIVPNYDETTALYRDKFDATVEKEWTVDKLPDLQPSYLDINGVQLENIGSSQPVPGRSEATDFAQHLRTTGRSVCI